VFLDEWGRYESCKTRIIADPMPHVSSPLWKSALFCPGRGNYFGCFRRFFFAVVKYLVAGLVTEVLVAVPAQTVIAINELQPPQVPAQAPRHAILP
jgi:hypothetical protein